MNRCKRSSNWSATSWSSLVRKKSTWAVQVQARGRRRSSRAWRQDRMICRQCWHVMGELYSRGVNPDFAALARTWQGKKVSLPVYPFERQRYWITDVARYAGQ